MENNPPHKKSRSKSHHRTSKPKKKLSPFYKISLSLLLIAFTALFYFVVIVSTEPKSFPYITKKIEENLKKNFGEDAALETSYISFTRYGTLKVAATKIKISYAVGENLQKKVFILPRLEAEFSLLDLLLLNFHPSKLRLISPDIVIDDFAKLQFTQTAETSEENNLSALLTIFSSIQSRSNSVEYFEIENAMLTIHEEEREQKILLKNSQIHIFEKGGMLNIMAQNQISFDVQKSDVDFDFNCQLSKDSSPKCEIFLTNFIPDSISNLHPALADFGKITANFDASAYINFEEGMLANASFKLRSQRGSFEFLDFFSKRIDFANFVLDGEYDHKNKNLILSNLESDFNGDDNSKNSSPRHFAMSMKITGYGLESERSEFEMSLQNFLGDDLDKYWPVNLNENDVRSWVVQHIKGGLIKDAKAKFSLKTEGQEAVLETMDAQINFSGLNLDYDPAFPPVSNIVGSANFTAQDMKITINSGEVLQTKISEGLVEIENFEADNVILKISGRSNGAAADALKHISSDKEFHLSAAKYFNGNAQSDFDVRLSLSQESDLKNSHIAVYSAINNLNNDYLHGSAIISTKKDFNSRDFITNIDLTGTEVSIKALDIMKKPLIESALDFTVSVNSEKDIRIKNISLSSRENILDKKTGKEAIALAKFTGDISFQTAPFTLTKLSLRNENFGKNNYNFTYNKNSKTGIDSISLKGKMLNFGPILEQKVLGKLGGEGSSALQFQASLGQVDFLRGKSLRNFNALINCQNNVCVSGFAKANYGNKQILNLSISKQLKNNFSNIEAHISDVGYLAEAFGISNVIAGGDAKIKIRNKSLNNKMFLEGEVNLDDKITIYETATVKRLAKDTLFSSIKDKIFSSEKTIFDSLKLEFDYTNNLLNIKSLIANNYKIGITAKGSVDLKNDSYYLKGMIVPCFLINNLFGLGKIPLIGGVISGVLTGGEGGGLFGIRYEYVKTKNDAEGRFTTNKVAAFVPSTIQNLFD